MKAKLLLICVLLTVNCAVLSAIDFFFRPKAFGYLPMGAGNETLDGNARYNVGGGADVGFEVDLSSIWPNPLGLGYFFGLEGGMTSNALLYGDSLNLANYSVGASFGFYYFPLSRLFVRLDGTAGIYSFVLDGFIGPTGLYWRAGGELGFRFTPSFLLALNTGWRQYEDSRPDRNPVSSGLAAGLSIQFTLEMGGGSSRDSAEAALVQYDSVYPAFLQLYQNNPVGTVTIQNKENAEIRNVRLSFRASPYTSSEFLCGSVAVIPRGREAELPLLADFSPDILRFTDDGRILGELVVRYNFLGQEREAVSSVTIAVHNRNAIPQGDLAALAAFVSPTSPETLNFAKNIVGHARVRRRAGHSQNMQFAIWLFEGLRASGIRVSETQADDKVQFPAETLSFRRGSVCDIALLFATAVEGVGISTALIRVGTDYIVAVNLSVGQAATETMFYNPDRVLIIDNEAWLPVAISAFNNGFMNSWTRAVVSLNQAFERGEHVDFIMTQDAWAVYPPAPLPTLATQIIRTDSEVLITEANLVMEQYIIQDIMPLVWRVESQLRSAPTAALFNRLGILFARAGRIPEAKTNYERAASMGSIPAMNNRASLALTERDHITAERWFRYVLMQDSTNVAAQRGLERVEGLR
jgi:hypothetical protein